MSPVEMWRWALALTVVLWGSAQVFQGRLPFLPLDESCSVLCIYHCEHPLTERHRGAFQSFTIVNKAVVDHCVQGFLVFFYFCKHQPSFLWNKYSGVRLLGGMVLECLVFKETAQQLSREPARLQTPSATCTAAAPPGWQELFQPL